MSYVLCHGIASRGGQFAVVLSIADYDAQRDHIHKAHALAGPFESPESAEIARYRHGKGEHVGHYTRKEIQERIDARLAPSVQNHFRGQLGKVVIGSGAVITDSAIGAGATARRDRPQVLDFETFQVANARRRDEETGPNALATWSLSDLTNALAGEAGELANFAKKARREGYLTIEKWKPHLAKELGDVVAYAAIVANKLELDLGTACREKFNEISDRFEFTTYIDDRNTIVTRSRPQQLSLFAGVIG